MDYPSAVTFEVYTPFILSDELFKGFKVTCKHIVYIRNGLGVQMIDDSYEGISKRFTMYNDYLDNIVPKMNVKVLSIKPICIYGEDFVEHVDFEVILNHYSITPTETLTYEIFYNFVKNINNELASVEKHPLKDFFVRPTVKDGNTFHRYAIPITPNDSLTLPDVYIPVTDTNINEKYILDVIHYMDSLKGYYQHQYHNKRTNAIKSYEKTIVSIPMWEDGSDEENA